MRFLIFLSALSLLPLVACQVQPVTRAKPAAAAPAAAAAADTEVKPLPAAPQRVRGDEPRTEEVNLGVVDPASAAAALLQKPDEAMARFPVDRNGYIDWVAALNKGLITPRNAVQGGGEAALMDLDILMRNTREMPYVVFPHRAHTQWLDCGNCHPALFAEKAGSTRMIMDDIFRGEHCGACHGRVAFSPFYACERCHRIPHGDVKAWW